MRRRHFDLKRALARSQRIGWAWRLFVTVLSAPGSVFSGPPTGSAAVTEASRFFALAESSQVH